MTSSLIFAQFAGITGTLCVSLIDIAMACAISPFGSVEFKTITNGFPVSFSSLITLSSELIYTSLSSSPIEPSVVTTTPKVECSSITFFVPISAASSNGIFSSYQGVFTNLALPFSSCPMTPGTI